MEKKIKLKKLKTPRATNSTFHFESVVKFKLDSEAERNKTTDKKLSFSLSSLCPSNSETSIDFYNSKGRKIPQYSLNSSLVGASCKSGFTNIFYLLFPSSL